MHNIQGYNFACIKQLSNHAMLLNVQKDGFKYQCYFTTITSKTKIVSIANNIDVDLMEFKLLNCEPRFIPKVIYKYTFTRNELLDLFNLEHVNSVELNKTVE